MDKKKEILDLLKENNIYWSVERNGRLYITNNYVLREYNDKNKELKSLIKNKLDKYKKRSISKTNSNSVVDA